MRKPSPTDTQPYSPLLRPQEGEKPAEPAPAPAAEPRRRTTDPLPKLLTALRKDRPGAERAGELTPDPAPIERSPTPAYEPTVLTAAPHMDAALAEAAAPTPTPKPALVPVAQSFTPPPVMVERTVAPEEAVATAWAIEGRLAALERSLGELVSEDVPGATELKDLLASVLPDDIHPDVLAGVRVVPSKLAKLMGRVGRAEARLHQVEHALDKVRAEEELRRRASPRRGMRTEVGMDSGSNFFQGFSAELSDGGLFVATDALLPVGTRLDVEFTVNGRRIKTPTTVRWVRDRLACGDQVEPGLGLSFDDLAPADRGAIEAFMVLRQPEFHVD